MNYTFIGIYISIGFAILNAILEELTLYFSEKIGHHSITNESQSSKSLIFTLSFFNVSIAILLIGANFQNIPILKDLFNGLYVDFTC